jgi:ankyrin repeat protein
MIAVFLPVSCRAQIASKSPDKTQKTDKNSETQNCSEAKGDSNEAPTWKESPLHSAIFNQDIKATKKLLAENAPVDEIAAHGDTALILVLSHRIPEQKPIPLEQRQRDIFKEEKFRLEAIKELFKHGADVDKKGFGGTTPLIKVARTNYAAEHQLRVLELLIKNKANVNLPDNRGMTALMQASENGKVEVVKFLLKHGADRSLKSCEGQTALMLARSANKVEIIQILETNN